MKQKLLLLLAVFFGLLAFMFTWQQIRREKQKLMSRAQEVELVLIVRDMAEGERIKEDDIKRIRIPRFNGIATREIPWSQKDRILDCPLADQIPAGTVLTWSDIKVLRSSSNRTGLSSLTRRGYRAVSIQVDPSSSVNGLIQPNDFLDVIGTFQRPDMMSDRSLDVVTWTVLQKVRVLACGADLGYAKPQAGAQTGSRTYGTVTLELTPKEAEMIIFARQKGRLTLILRSSEDPDITADLPSLDWKQFESSLPRFTREREDMLKKNR